VKTFASPVSIMENDSVLVGAASGWVESERQKSGPALLLGDASLMAASRCISDLIQDRIGKKPIVQMHGHHDKRCWRLEVKVPGAGVDERYIVVTQSDVICLWTRQCHTDDTLRMPLSEAITWLLRRRDLPTAT